MIDFWYAIILGSDAVKHAILATNSMKSGIGTTKDMEYVN